jgi:hypothetical protein
MEKKLSVKNKILIALGIIILLFILTNPSMKSFKEYRGRDNTKGLRREQNWIVFSIYGDGNYKFVGVFKNFINIGYYQ